MIRSLLARPEQAARVAVARARLRFVNGVEWMIRDPKSVVGQTPWDPVLQEDKLVVRRYRHPKGADRGPARRYATPVVLVPPLMVKPFVFDLHPGRSFVLRLLEAGYPVYLIDFGEPDRADDYITLDHYVCDFMPSACEAIRRDAGSRALSLAGYCMGALFALCHASANDDRDVRNIVAVAAPVDTAKMGVFAWLAKRAGGNVETLVRRMGNVPGGLSSTAFKLLTPAKNVTRYADLFMNMWNDEYVNGFDAMNAWTGEFIDYPQEAFIQFVTEFMQKNALVKGKMQFRGKPADLGTLRAALLLFAGATDNIAPEGAVRAALDACGGTDKTFEVVPGGHMGVLAGGAAPERVWDTTAAWLAPRSDVVA